MEGDAPLSDTVIITSGMISTVYLCYRRLREDKEKVNVVVQLLLYESVHS